MFLRLGQGEGVFKLKAKKVILGSGRLRAGSIIAEEAGRFFPVPTHAAHPLQPSTSTRIWWLNVAADSRPLGIQILEHFEPPKKWGQQKRLWGIGCGKMSPKRSDSVDCYCGYDLIIIRQSSQRRCDQLPVRLMGTQYPSEFERMNDVRSSVHGVFWQGSEHQWCWGWVLAMASFPVPILRIKAGLKMWASTSCWPAGHLEGFGTSKTFKNSWSQQEDWQHCGGRGSWNLCLSLSGSCEASERNVRWICLMDSIWGVLGAWKPLDPDTKA